MVHLLVRPSRAMQLLIGCLHRPARESDHSSMQQADTTFGAPIAGDWSICRQRSIFRMELARGSILIERAVQ